MDERQRLVEQLRRFGAIEAPSSPLYQRLAPLIAEREPLVDLLLRRQSGQPPANVILAALQRRLIDRPDVPLAAYYPTLGGRRAVDAGLVAAFDAFWPAELPVLAALVRARRVATNEVRRAAVLRLGYVAIARALMADGRLPAAHVVEIGTSAGLTLLWDRFAFVYGTVRTGHVAPVLTMTTAWRGEHPPACGPALEVLSRLGVDLEPQDVHDEDAMAWLRALVWPEHLDRVAAFDAALAVARADPPPLVAADALVYLPAGLDALPTREPAVVVHGFTVNQFSPAMRRQLDQALADAAEARPVFRLGYEWAPGPGCVLELTTYPGGRSTLLAVADAHGAWVEPRDPSVIG
ncbi:MAG: DUF2332 domain-containing protein [Pseudomonadota bacterium]